VSSGFETHLLVKVGSDVATSTVALDPWGGLESAACLATTYPASLLGGLRATTCPMISCGPWATSIKKSLAGLPVRLGPCVPNARAHVSKMLDVKAIKGLQDVRAGDAVNACRTCGHAATVLR
jgi:hypothetical protein